MITLPKLQYETNALEPYISQKAVEFHYDKHHVGYINNLNKLLPDNKCVSNDGLVDIILDVKEKKTDESINIFNNAGQILNHNLFWNSIDPNSNIEGTKIQKQIIKDFESFENFKEKFKSVGLSQFGSGWVWLVLNYEKNKLEIIKTSNADSPYILNNAKEYKILLTCDVWEHAYYLDYQNRRVDFLSIFIEKLSNWQFASSLL